MDGRLPFAWLELARKVLACVLAGAEPIPEIYVFRAEFPADWRAYL